VQLVEQDMLTPMEYLSSSLVFSGDHVAQTYVWCFVNYCLSFSFWPLCSLSTFELRLLITSTFKLFFEMIGIKKHYLGKNCHWIVKINVLGRSCIATSSITHGWLQSILRGGLWVINRPTMVTRITNHRLPMMAL
jgi:hypothetical protein